MDTSSRMRQNYFCYTTNEHAPAKKRILLLYDFPPITMSMFAADPFLRSP